MDVVKMDPISGLEGGLTTMLPKLLFETDHYRESSALRVPSTETRLTVYRRLEVTEA